jgi:two-component system NtrC family sensor kinase
MAYFMIKKNLFSEEDFVMAAHRDKLAFMGTLSSSINHEIRNPLYIAQGSSESFLQSLDENLISKNDAGEKAIQILRESKKQISRALDIVASFSNFTKIDANEDQKTKVDVSHVIHNVLTFVGHEATKKKIKITKGIGDESVQILVNERQLEQILLNLILNAIQAFKKTEGLIELNIKRSESQIEIKIEDNGPGMAKKQLDQIFEPFYTTKEEGTGLGLYITKQLVERNGGTIKVESKEGSGTTFILEFKRL